MLNSFTLYMCVRVWVYMCVYKLNMFILPSIHSPF